MFHYIIVVEIFAIDSAIFRSNLFIGKKASPSYENRERFKVSILSPPENALSLPVKALSNYGFLIGRVATSSVYDKNNVPIVKKGALVTKKVVFDAHRKNRLIALTIATKR